MKRKRRKKATNTNGAEARLRHQMGRAVYAWFVEEAGVRGWIMPEKMAAEWPHERLYAHMRLTTMERVVLTAFVGGQQREGPVRSQGPDECDHYEGSLVNAILRNGNSRGRNQIKDYLHVLDTALGKMRCEEGPCARAVIGGSKAGLLKLYQSRIGSTVEDCAYTSAVAGGFCTPPRGGTNHDFFLTIHSRTGRVLWPYGREVVFPRGTRFNVLEYAEIGGRPHFHVAEDGARVTPQTEIEQQATDNMSEISLRSKTTKDGRTVISSMAM